MAVFEAGAAKRPLRPKVGAPLLGYGTYERISEGIHDTPQVRTVVMCGANTPIVICALEVLWLRNQEIRQIRSTVETETGVPSGNVFICATHTHSVPAPHMHNHWEEALPPVVASTVSEALSRMRPAHIGHGYGSLYGYSINRRRLNDPIDPSVAVVRIDTIDGTPICVLGNFGCHAVVLGYRNTLISADWPGYCSSQLEERFGGHFVALLTQGGAADINPITETVRIRLQAGYPVKAGYDLSTMYGQHVENLETADSRSWRLTDRAAGSFDEADHVGRALSNEVLKVWQGVLPRLRAAPRVERVLVDGRAEAKSSPHADIAVSQNTSLPDIRNEISRMEIMLIAIGDLALLGHPGESFSETAVLVRKRFLRRGYRTAFLVTYANGCFGYLPPSEAFAEGGYEVAWAETVELPISIQNRMWEATELLLTQNSKFFGPT